MAYMALYRKYRSQEFEDVIGQEHVTRTLQNAISRGTVGQAYLFTGSRGTGKTTVARLLAKAVNCETGPTPNPCNKCSLCVAITQGTAVDVTEVDAASNRGVNEMESICEGVRYRPMEARYRVVILDEAHQLSDHAKDAFLKTLEEPPPHVIFVLATTEPGKIPITIRSRCQQFDFHRGTIRQIQDRLNWVCIREGINIEESAARLIAAHGQGSWRDGLSLLEQVIAFSGGDITVEAARKVLGAVPEEIPAQLLASIASNDISGLISQVREIWNSGADPARLLSSLVEQCRTTLEEIIAGKTPKAPLDQLTADRLIRIIYHLSQSEADLRNWLRADLAIEVALLSALNIAGGQQSEPATDFVQPAAPSPEPRKAPAPKPAAPADTAATASETDIPDDEPAAEPMPLEPAAPVAEADLDMVKRAWPRVLQAMRSERANTSLCAILKDGMPASFEANTLTIVFPASYAFHVTRAEQPEARSIVEQAFQKVAGIKLKLKVALAGDEKAGGKKKLDTGQDRSVNGSNLSPSEIESAENMTKSEFIQLVLDTFGGEVLDDQDPYQ